MGSTKKGAARKSAKSGRGTTKSAKRPKPVAKKSATKKSVAKKSVAKKSVAKKSVATKSVATKSVAKKSASSRANGAAAKKKAASKTPAKKPAAKKAKSAGATKRPSKKRVAERLEAGLAVLQRHPAPIVEAAPDEALVDQTIEKLHVHDEQASASALEIGRFVLARYFDGDADRVRSKSPTRPASYARLAERAEDETAWDARALRDAVVAAIVYDALPSELAERVPPSYLARLDPIDDAVERDAIARRIADGSLRGQLATSAIAAASASHRHGGRPRSPGPVRFAAILQRTIERASEYDGLDVSEVKHLDTLARMALAGRIDDAARRLSALAARIRNA